MSRDSISDSVAGFIGIMATVFVVLVIVVEFIINSTAEGALWDGIGQAFGAMGRATSKWRGASSARCSR